MNKVLQALEPKLEAPFPGYDFKIMKDGKDGPLAHRAQFVSLALVTGDMKARLTVRRVGDQRTSRADEFHLRVLQFVEKIGLPGRGSCKQRRARRMVN
jgi:hypothetical protein